MACSIRSVVMLERCALQRSPSWSWCSSLPIRPRGLTLELVHLGGNRRDLLSPLLDDLQIGDLQVGRVSLGSLLGVVRQRAIGLVETLLESVEFRLVDLAAQGLE